MHNNFYINLFNVHVLSKNVKKIITITMIVRNHMLERTLAIYECQEYVYADT